MATHFNEAVIGEVFMLITTDEYMWSLRLDWKELNQLQRLQLYTRVVFQMEPYQARMYDCINIAFEMCEEMQYEPEMFLANRGPTFGGITYLQDLFATTMSLMVTEINRL